MQLEKLERVWTAYRHAAVSQVIAPDDQMLDRAVHNGLEQYLQTGETGLKAILGALALAPTERIDRFLDLPCGHGRVARHLVAAFPGADGFYSDIDVAGVRYCATSFSGTGILSRPELTDVDLPQDLDLIWVGSLFTHVDEPRTARWLAFLAQHLREGGVLVATFHGLWSTRVQPVYPLIDASSWSIVEKGFHERGYGYANYPTSQAGAYGISLSSPSKTIGLATAIEGTRVVSYTERGWADNQDVLALARLDRYKPWALMPA